LIHNKRIIGIIEALYVLKVSHLTLEKCEVVGKHLPVKFFADELVSLVVLVLGFSSVVDIAVECVELLPFFQICRHVVCILFTNIQEIFSRGEIVKHYSPSYFIEKLLFEIIALIESFLDSLSFLREHVLLGFFENMPHFVDLFDQSWILHLPLLVILLFEKFIFFSIQHFLLPLIFLV
jgi:hypothetical protein